MAHNAWIFEEGVLAFEDMIVGAANTDVADGQPNPAGRGSAGRRALDDIKHTRFLTKHCSHDGSRILKMKKPV
jgi:hypothetical protein